MSLIKSFKNTKKISKTSTTMVTMKMPVTLIKRFKSYKKREANGTTMSSVCRFLLNKYLDEADKCRKNGKY